jgi:REP-associated tyrosine transposase
MPNYRRTYIPCVTYFFTVNTYGRRVLLLDELVRRALREGVNLACDALPFVIDAWILLLDHLYGVWTLPLGDADFSKRWVIIKRTVSRRCGHKRCVGREKL